MAQKAQLQLLIHPGKENRGEATTQNGCASSQDLPNGRCFCATDLQEIVAFLQLEVGEDQSNGVPGLCQNGPRAVGIVFILGREVRAGNGAACSSQGPSAGAFGWEERSKEQALLRIASRTGPSTRSLCISLS